MTSIKKPKIYWVLLVQIVLLIVIGLVLAVLYPQLTYSAFAGGLIAIIPQLYFSLNVFRFCGAHQSHRIVRSFNRGESGKFFLTLIGFALVFSLSEFLNVIVLFVVYVLLVLVQIVGTAIVVNAKY